MFFHYSLFWLYMEMKMIDIQWDDGNVFFCSFFQFILIYSVYEGPNYQSHSVWFDLKLVEIFVYMVFFSLSLLGNSGESFDFHSKNNNTNNNNNDHGIIFIPWWFLVIFDYLTVCLILCVCVHWLCWKINVLFKKKTKQNKLKTKKNKKNKRIRKKNTNGWWWW